MKKILALGLVLASMVAWAQDDVKYSMGLKIWNHTWTGLSKPSMSVNSPLLSGSLKYKDFSLTASSLLQTSYVDTGLTSIYAVRTDTDYAIGYTLYDKLTFLVGSKTISGPDYSDMTGTLYGLTYVQPIHNEGFLYGTLVQSNNFSNLGGANANGKLSLADVGYGYVINKNTSLNIGYRQQILITSSDAKYTFGGATFGVGFNF